MIYKNYVDHPECGSPEAICFPTPIHWSSYHVEVKSSSISHQDTNKSSPQASETKLRLVTRACKHDKRNHATSLLSVRRCGTAMRIILTKYFSSPSTAFKLFYRIYVNKYGARTLNRYYYGQRVLFTLFKIPLYCDRIITCDAIYRNKTKLTGSKNGKNANYVRKLSARYFKRLLRLGFPVFSPSPPRHFVVSFSPGESCFSFLLSLFSPSFFSFLFSEP